MTEKKIMMQKIAMTTKGHNSQKKRQKQYNIIHLLITYTHFNTWNVFVHFTASVYSTLLLHIQKLKILNRPFSILLSIKTST